MALKTHLFIKNISLYIYLQLFENTTLNDV